MVKLFCSWLAVFYLWVRFYLSAVLRLAELRYLGKELPTVTNLQDVENRCREVTWTPDWKLAPHVKLRRLWWDCLSYAETVWARKKDDGDGFAILACELCKQLGIKAYILSVFTSPGQYSHAVAFGRHSGNPFMFNNGRLVWFDAAHTVEHVVQNAASGHDVVAWSLEDHETGELVRLHIGLSGQVPTILKRRKKK